MGILNDYDLKELYPKYVQYHEDLNRDKGTIPVTIHDFKDFSLWVGRLDEIVIRRFISNWEKDYNQVIEESKRELF